MSVRPVHAGCARPWGRSLRVLPALLAPPFVELAAAPVTMRELAAAPVTMGARVHVRMHARMCAVVRACLQAKALACVYAYMRVRMCACVRLCARACVRAYMRAGGRACVSVRACMRACVHACMRACMRACMHACMSQMHSLEVCKSCMPTDLLRVCMRLYHVHPHSSAWHVCGYVCNSDSRRVNYRVTNCDH